MRISRTEMFQQMTNLVSQRSPCQRAQVGALITKDNRILSMGYNGPPTGVDCTKCLGAGCNISIHAEANAIGWAARNGLCIKGATMWCTYSPCINCAKLIAASGIKEVIFTKYYRLDEGEKFLTHNTLVTVTHMFF